MGLGAPVESLFPAGRVRGILREVATVTTEGAQPDIAEAVRLIARAQPIAAMPRQRLTALGHSILLLFDAGPAMLPFTRDKQQLAATAARVLGRDRVRVADFIADPLQGVRAQRSVRWEMLHWPGRGSSVIVVADLGLGSEGAAAAPEQWQPFIAEAHRQGLRTVLLIPYPRARWPAAAKLFDAALTWDLKTGVQALRRAARRRARAA